MKVEGGTRPQGQLANCFLVSEPHTQCNNNVTGSTVEATCKLKKLWGFIIIIKKVRHGHGVIVGAHGDCVSMPESSLSTSHAPVGVALRGARRVRRR